MGDKHKGQAILNKFVEFIEGYVRFPDTLPGQSLVCALWAIHTWVYERFGASPKLDIAAATKQSGKTLLQEVLLSLSRNGKYFVTIRPLALVRLREAYEGRITMFLDEAEKLASETLGDTRSLLASSYLKGGKHLITSGKSATEFGVYMPVCFAQIGDIQPVLRDRSIVIDLQRGTPPRSDFRANREAAEAIAAELVGELREYFATGGAMAQTVPEFLSGREREIWTPLFSIAAHLGANVATTRLLQAAATDAGNRKKLPARKFSSEVDEKSADDRTFGELAIRDMCAVLREGEGGMFTATVLERLRDIPTSPWRTFGGPEGLTDMTLRALVAPFFGDDEKSSLIRLPAGVPKKQQTQRRGFKRADIERAAAMLEGGKV